MVTEKHLRTIQTTLRVLRAGLILAIPVIGIGVWYTLPEPPIFVQGPIESVQPVASQVVAHDLAWYAPLWERDLKQPPIPRSVAEPANQLQQQVPVPTLLATLVEPEGCFAHFAGNSGRPELKAVNDSIAGYVVQAIEPGRVQLTQGERVVWVELPRGAPSP